MTRTLLLALAALAAPVAQAHPVTYHFEASPWQTWIENSGHGFAPTPVRSMAPRWTSRWLPRWRPTSAGGMRP